MDEALLRSLLYSAHSKVALEFLHLESGTLKFRHILSMNRMMYHHHLLTTDDEESIKKIYDKQKEDPTKGDWYELLQNDFKFIGEEINEEQIKSMSKSEYKKHIKELVQIASYKYLMKEKEKHTKLDDVTYTDLKIQPYLTDCKFSKEERKLLIALRSRCHSAKTNFRKLNKGNLGCSLGCNTDENQAHIFQDCQVLNPQNTQDNVEYNFIFKETNKQKQAIQIFLSLEEKRKLKLLSYLEEQDTARTGAQIPF